MYVHVLQNYLKEKTKHVLTFNNMEYHIFTALSFTSVSEKNNYENTKSMEP